MSQAAYMAGDFWRICDRCGFKHRASQTTRTWDGLYVCRADWETRHPQDFVRGRKDNQVVPNPRPETVDNLVGNLTTVTTATASAGATSFSVESTARFQSTDTIGVMLDSGEIERHTIFAVPSLTSIQINEPLGGSVAEGAVVIDYTALADVDIG